MERINVSAGCSVSDVILLTEGAERSWEISIEAGAQLSLVFVALPKGADSISCDVAVSFLGEGGSCNLRGLYIAGDASRVNFTINLLHNYPSCNSRQLFKGILAGEARTGFYGLIKVPEKCIGTEAYQENHNLLLSDRCHADSLPQLEIYADDVICSHGATFGRLNEDELFYMRSRGIPEAEARRLQMVAFASEVLEGLPEEIAGQAIAALDNIV